MAAMTGLEAEKSARKVEKNVNKAVTKPLAYSPRSCNHKSK